MHTFRAAEALNVGDEVALSADMTVCHQGTDPQAIIIGRVVGGRRTKYVCASGPEDIGQLAASAGQLTQVLVLGVAWKGSTPGNAALTLVAPGALAIGLPSEGRTVGTVSGFISNNATYNVADFLPGRSVSAAFQAANDAAAPVRGKVIVPQGIWTFDTTVNIISDGVTFEGYGAGSIIRSTNGSFNLFTLGSAAHRTKFRMLRFEGGATTDATTQFAIYTNAFAAPDYCSVADCFFGTDNPVGSSLNNGVKIDGGNGWRVSRCDFRYLIGKISNTGYGILAGTTNGLHAHHNKFWGTTGRGRHAVYLSGGCTKCDVHDNHVENFAEDAFPIYSKSFQAANIYNHVHDNFMLNCGQLSAESAGCSVLGNSALNIVERNRIVNFQGYGVLVDALTEPGICDRNSVRHNWIYLAQWSGTMDYGGKRTKWIANEIVDASQASPGSNGAMAIRTSGTVVSDGLRFYRNITSGAAHRSGLELSDADPPTNLIVRYNSFPDSAAGVNRFDNPHGHVFYGGPTNDFGILADLSGDNGDINITLKAGFHGEVQQFNSVLSVDRTVTLDLGSAFHGARFRIVRHGLGAHTLSVVDSGAVTLKIMPSATAAWAEFESTGSTWYLVGYGLL